MERFLDQSLKGGQELRRRGSVERQRTVRQAEQLTDSLGLGWISRTLSLASFTEMASTGGAAGLRGSK